MNRCSLPILPPAPIDRAVGSQKSAVLVTSRPYDTVARGFMVLLFPLSATDKMLHWDTALVQANSSFLPDGQLLLIIAIIIEITCPVLIMIRRYDKPAAIALAVFCVATAILYHNFWAYPGLFSPKGGPALSQLWDFLKNFSVAGGLMFVIRDAHYTR
jgi:putative oxidoreductase